MILIGENLNVMSKVLGPAMKAREAKPIQEMAAAETEAGVDYIDVNIGPARKAGAELMEWLVKTIQEVTDLPLFLDTTNVEAIEAGLKAHKGKAVINSIMARPERMDALLPLAQKYNACGVALLWGPEGMPRDDAERGALAAELMIKAAEYGSFKALFLVMKGPGKDVGASGSERRGHTVHISRGEHRMSEKAGQHFGTGEKDDEFRFLVA